MVGIRERIATLQQPQRTLVFPIIALTKVIIFSRWKKNTGMRLIVKYLLPCSAMLFTFRYVSMRLRLIYDAFSKRSVTFAEEIKSYLKA